jgi:membrane protease YdiL (CAAX protease family)
MPSSISHTLTLLTFLLLGLAICSVWLKPVSFAANAKATPWMALFAAAVISGWAAGVLYAPAVIALAAFAACAWLAATAQQKTMRVVFGLLTLLLGFALAIHRLPGFNNPIVIAGAMFSPDAARFTQYANFDKGTVGLMLLALLCNRVRTRAEMRDVLNKTLPVLALTLIAVLATAVGIGLVHPDVKLPEVTLLFLAVNLFFTVIAEEAFFRGFIQARIAASLTSVRHGGLIAAACSALLFGAAHLAGGPAYALLAFIAGLGYAYAYHKTQRIEAPILIHIALNAVHFIGFTYPYIK